MATTAKTATLDAGFDGFDVDAYAAKYSGRNRINRLLFLAKKSAVLRHDAHEVLLRDLKNSLNMKLYLEVAELAAAASEDVPESVLSVDHAHVEQVKLSASQQHERLEQELNSYKSTMIKESIRMGYNDLGDFYYQLGDLPSALKSYAQARDYRTADKHIIEMCLNVIKVGLHMQNYGHVKSYLLKLEQVASSQNDPILKSKISAVFGLVALHEKSYREAALRFTACQADIGSSYNEVIHAEDIALYGGLCALASCTREELRDGVINSTSFKAFLELLPWLRELINDFYTSNYAVSLQALDKAKPELHVDLYLSEHVKTLCQDIRSRGLVQFFHPYLSVDLHQMAKSFNTATADLETELGQLIMAGKIAARLDSYGKILYAYQPNKRNATYKRALDVGHKYVAESKNQMLRMSLLKNNILVREI